MMGSTKKEKLKRLISLYFTQLRQTKILIKGKDLIKLGVEPGPVFSKIMGEVLNARLNGRLKTKKDEIDYAIELIST
jgi:tRNA nucleotidyltransferase (CCA-adding enzyme)